MTDPTPEHEAILDRLLAHDPPELRADPEFREHMRGTYAYQAAVLDAELRKLGRAGAREADKLAQRFRTTQERALRRAMPGLLPPVRRRRWWRRRRG
jgi:hypothetical protein